MKKYRKLPVVIDAVQAIEENLDEIESLPNVSFLHMPGLPGFNLADGRSFGIYITTLEGVMECLPGDFIIRGVSGELYPCKPDIFWKTYEEAE